MANKTDTIDHVTRLDTFIGKLLTVAEQDLDDTKARTAAILIGELRKIRKLETDQNEELTIERVVEWYKAKPTTERSRILRAISAVDGKKSGLA